MAQHAADAVETGILYDLMLGKRWEKEETATCFLAQRISTLRRSSGLPSGYVKRAIEHDPVEIVDFPIVSMVIFHVFLYVYQAG